MFDELKDYYRNKGIEITPEIERCFDESLERETFKKNEIILREGEACKNTFFVAKGLLRAYTVTEAGKEHILQFAPEEWFISDRSSSLFEDPSRQYIDAVEDTEAILIDNEFFEKMTEISVDFQKYNWIALNNRIRHLNKRINLLISASAEARYMDFIDVYPDILLRVPQWMVASYLGITPESLSRVRKELARKNFKPD